MAIDNILSKANDYYSTARIKSNSHYAMAVRKSSYNVRMGFTTTILSTVVGTTIFATLSKGHPASAKEMDIIGIITGILSVAAATLAALQTFLGYSENAEKHRKSALAFSGVCNSVELFLLKYTLTPEMEKIKFEWDALESLNKIIDAFQKADEAAPTIANSVYKKHQEYFRVSKAVLHTNAQNGGVPQD